MRNEAQAAALFQQLARLTETAAQIQAHRAAREAAEPTRIERQEEQREIAAARDTRRARLEQAKLEESDRAQAAAAEHHAATDAAAEAAAKADEQAANDLASQVAEDEAAKKAERDRRYAERKAKKR